MTADPVIHYVESLSRPGTYGDTRPGYDTACGDYIIDSRIAPERVTPHKTGVTCRKCLRALARREKENQP